jgi:hypothetical protein
MHPNAKIRQSLLQTLYQAREKSPRDGWVSERDLKDAHGDIAFALDVLGEVGQVKSDGFCHRITGAGMLAAEAG